MRIATLPQPNLQFRINHNNLSTPTLPSVARQVAQNLFPYYGRRQLSSEILVENDESILVGAYVWAQQFMRSSVYPTVRVPVSYIDHDILPKIKSLTPYSTFAATKRREKRGPEPSDGRGFPGGVHTAPPPLT